MPYFYMKEIWTPLKLVHIRLFRCQDTGRLYIKFGDKNRQQIKTMRKHRDK